MLTTSNPAVMDAVAIEAGRLNHSGGALTLFNAPSTADHSENIPAALPMSKVSTMLSAIRFLM